MGKMENMSVRFTVEGGIRERRGAGEAMMSHRYK
jgi:hypothetical protein